MDNSRTSIVNGLEAVIKNLKSIKGYMEVADDMAYKKISELSNENRLLKTENDDLVATNKRLDTRYYDALDKIESLSNEIIDLRDTIDILNEKLAEKRIAEPDINKSFSYSTPFDQYLDRVRDNFKYRNSDLLNREDPNEKLADTNEGFSYGDNVKYSNSYFWNRDD